MRVTTPRVSSHSKVSLRENAAPPARSLVRRLLVVAAALVAAALAAGFLGALHPAGDSFAVFRGSLSGLGLVIAAAVSLAAPRRWALAAALVPALSLGTLLPHWVQGAPVQGGITLYQKNLHYQTRDVSLIAADILAEIPDVVTLQELHRNNARILGDLHGAYPWQVVCHFPRHPGQVALLSRHPFRDGGACSETPGMAHAVVETPDGPVSVASIHFHWPWPAGTQPGQARRLLPEIAALEGPVVIGGDFNMVRWSATLRRIARAADAQFVGRAAMSYAFAPGPFSGVSIDHVLGPQGGTTEFRPPLGSDHRGVLARVRLD